MQSTSQLGKHIREVYTGGNWTTVNLKDLLSDVSWQDATTQLYTLNSIATLVYHINYYSSAATKVLQGGPLDAKDEYSFSPPPIQSNSEWKVFIENVLNDGIHFAECIEQLDDTTLPLNFTDEKYGSYYRNILGIIEHTHYHLGQISLVKKLLALQKHKTD